MSDREDNPLTLDHPDEARRLREALDRAGYSPQRIGELLGVNPQELASFRAFNKNPAVLLQRTVAGTPLDTFVRLFLLGQSVTPDAARAAFSPSTPQHWVTAGLLQTRGEDLASILQLTAYEQLLFFTDALWSAEPHPKHVLGVGAPTFFLSQMTVRRPSRRTLDVGCGSGIQAFLAAPHSGQLVGVDLNPRAVNVAAFNAQLNGLTNSSFLQGDLYAPVRDGRFDLIVANPPYVISPEARYLFRDSGLKGDEITQRVIREGVGLLEEGGYLQLMCEWAHLRGQNWRARLASWFEGTGCDAWVLCFTTVDSLKHAEVWLRPRVNEPAESLPARLREWLDYHESEGIEAVSDGVISLRKRSGATNWVRFDDQPPERIGSCGASIERGFAAADFLQATIHDEALLAARVRMAPDVTWDQRQAPAEGGWKITQRRLGLSAGLAFKGDVDAECLALIDRCRGTMTVREVFDSLSQQAGQPVDPSMFLPVVRRLVEQGLLLPV